MEAVGAFGWCPSSRLRGVLTQNTTIWILWPWEPYNLARHFIDLQPLENKLDFLPQKATSCQYNNSNSK
jgi:hypothetical protein